MNLTPFFSPRHSVSRAVLFLSGSGTNAVRLLESLALERFRTWIPSVLLTDAPETSAAIRLGQAFEVPVIALDIRQFYRERGETRVSLFTERGREIREEWTDALRRMLLPYEIDFGILAGFVPLTNLTADFPCLNVHPGDLTVEEGGHRLLTGLHTVPIEAALLRGDSALRSSVIVAQTYTGKGGEMDSGPIIGLSPAVEADRGGETVETLLRWASDRPDKRPPGGYKDRLEILASENQQRLKVNGDWVLFPPAAADFASGRFAQDSKGRLYFRTSNDWQAVRTVLYDSKGVGIPVPLTD